MSDTLLLVAAITLTALAVVWFVYGVYLLFEKGPAEADTKLEYLVCPNGWPIHLCHHGRAHLWFPQWAERSSEPWSPSGQGGM